VTDVVIPEEIVGEAAEGAISIWLFRDGETVVAGDVLAEVMNEKAAAELVAPAAGRLKILVPAETPVRMGQVVARIES
jgi:pyruvate/2-oxoglutarate dehydrogenase complex dihydrolipoamide acyltransferase (E2) component